MISALMVTSELGIKLRAGMLKLVDASWHMPSSGRNSRAEYEAAHIPSAVFFDHDAISDTSSPYPHMIPSEAEFGAAMEALGISNHDTVLVYDTGAPYAAARAWWMFHLFGHDKVRVLDGGLTKWRAEGLAVTTEASWSPPATFKAHLDRSLLRTTDQISANLASGAEQVLDARSAERFTGHEPEPRPSLRSGHIPGSKNLPSRLVMDSASQTYLPPSRLVELFAAAGIDLSKPIITTCGSGVTASVLALALYESGARQVPVYDGSWSEWGARDDTPVETSP